jgi:hypothetical protein
LSCLASRRAAKALIIGRDSLSELSFTGPEVSTGKLAGCWIGLRLRAMCRTKYDGVNGRS